MTTYTTYTSGANIANQSGASAGGSPRQATIHNTVDFSLRNVTAADVVAALSIPANTLVRAVFIRVLTGEASQTLSLGDGSDTDGWLVGVDVGTTGNAHCSALALTEGTPNTVTGYTGGKFYSAADTLDILVPSGKAYTTLKVWIQADVTLFA